MAVRLFSVVVFGCERDRRVKTYVPRTDDIKREWFVVDVAGKPLGRVAVRIANVLRGKIKRTFTPSVDMGDFVVVVNAAKVELTGSKEDNKIYQRFSGYRGGLRQMKASLVRQRHPERLVEEAVHGMLPRNNMGRSVFRRLKVYPGDQHPHAAQKPKAMQV